MWELQTLKKWQTENALGAAIGLREGHDKTNN